MILEELRRSDPPDTQHVLEELCKLEASSIPGGRVSLAQTLVLSFSLLVCFSGFTLSHLASLEV